MLPRIAAAFVIKPETSVSPKPEAVFEVSGAMIVVYLALVIWIALVSWFCLRFLERLPFAALGYALHRGWWRDVVGVGHHNHAPFGEDLFIQAIDAHDVDN